MFKYIILVLVAAFIIIQFFRIDKTNPTYNESEDFITITKPSDEVKNILVTACYDCHSYKTEYPWYSNVAPASWFLAEHIEDGRRHLNFSIWGTYPADKAAHKLEEVADEVEEGEMPLSSYTIMHGDAKLTDAQKEALVSWVKSL
ncbi:heme-binding domain-containing protein [Fulvivirga ligni]|uniref:heme-binding domain-containing protein n=1 Tax=Fulvivirga ligni TaxID=2904246 RepID=UPI001F244565|nr:heme-binding domain-containing protein [Fulvivirga ligni]UII20354.1 heme-binding domain-containing protein [Fulvivirga ligni]